MNVLLTFHCTPEQLNTLDMLQRMQEARELHQHRHSERLCSLAEQVAEMLGLDGQQCLQLQLGCLLHDIGIVGIPDKILLKPGGLDPMEMAEMRMHPLIGEHICRPAEWLEPVMSLIRSHHEKINGSGYPDGLRGDELSLSVRVLSALNVYDALRLERSHRPAFTHAAAMDLMQEEVQAGWWDAEVVQALAACHVNDNDFR